MCVIFATPHQEEFPLTRRVPFHASLSRGTGGKKRFSRSSAARSSVLISLFYSTSFSPPKKRERHLNASSYDVSCDNKTKEAKADEREERRKVFPPPTL
jgi:hypothetical protein